jgi:predicted nucleic acid-binding protein
MIYCLDTNTLIHAWRFWYAQQTHPTLWEALVDLGEAGALKIPEQVLDELSQRDDALYMWCRERADLLVHESTDETEEAYGALVNTYPHMTGGLGMGSNYADLYVIAVAQVNGATVVTDEDIGFMDDPNRKNRKLHNFKITNICFDQGVQLMRIYDLLRSEGWIFTH